MIVSLPALAAQLADTMLCDQHALRRRLRALEHGRVSAEQQAAYVARLTADMETSCTRRAQRVSTLPKPVFPPELPVSQRWEEIATAIAQHQVVIVCGETGSGKTTQLPKICLALGRGVAGLIGHTQPRRIAARAVATRIAQELNSPLGQAVGYKVRFSDQTSPASHIKLMTDGILLAEIQGDRYLNQYDTLIIDEAHERSLNIDFLLGYLKQLLPRRPGLKIIITSATIDPQRFSRHFDGAPVIEVSGRTYPVDVRYRPLLAQDEDGRDRDMQNAILDAVDELAHAGPGDVLIFLSGEREIRETAEALRKHHPAHAEILPLYARLSAQEQNRVFQPHAGRRIVLATNVAETSLTVPGIRYVIDTGYARVSRYSHRSKVQRLPIEPISQASANQRAGRCGRVSAGVCIRLYDEADYRARPVYTEPEIQRSNLAAAILQMHALRLGDVDAFPFVDPPHGRLINDGYQTLVELGAVDERRQLTAIGHQLARLPVDPRIARMILAAQYEGALCEILIIASALTVQDPRERPLDASQAADQRHKSFQDERSDFLGYLKLWNTYHEQARHLTQSKLRQWCKENFLSYVRLRDWHDVHGQIAALVKEAGQRPNEEPAPPEAVHRALLAGLLGNIGCKGENQEYLGARGIKFHIFPGSALHKKGPAWLMAAELTETARLYARTVAPIDVQWVERLAGHLIKKSYFEPHWEKKQGAVIVYERVLLYGLTLVPRRKVHYGRIDPTVAREIFIRNALVEGEYQTQARFFANNRALITEVQDLEHKSRRHDILVDAEMLYAFYDERIPDGIFDHRTFEHWRKDIERENPQSLFLTKEYLMRHTPALGTNQFPESLRSAGMVLPLSYRFEPGDTEDGVTVTVPLAALNQLSSDALEWLVPGLLHEKIVALIKLLPKPLRRNFVPVPDFADACAHALAAGEGNLREALARQLQRMTGVNIPHDAWQLEHLPPHLAMNIKVISADGALVAMGRDLARLRGEQGEKATQTFSKLPVSDFERDNVTRWDFGELPAHVEFRRQDMNLIGYPALVDEGGKVSLRLHDTPHKAQAAMRPGLRRLFMLQIPDKIKYLEKNLPGLQAMCLQYARIGNCESLRADVILAIVDHVFIGDFALPRTDTEFQLRLQQGLTQLLPTSNELCRWVGEALTQFHSISKELSGALAPTCQHAAADVREQLACLIYPNFISATPYGQLRHLPRYFKASALRLEKVKHNPTRDRELSAQITPLWQAYLQRAESHRHQGISDPELMAYRWLLEELRVSLYAQELKTAVPVSPQRIQKQWVKVQM